MKKGFFVMVLVLVLVFSISSYTVSSHGPSYVFNNDDNHHLHYEKAEDRFPAGQGNPYRTRLYFDNNLSFIDTEKKVNVSFPRAMRSIKNYNDYTNGAYTLKDKGKWSDGYWVSIKDPNPPQSRKNRKTYQAGGLSFIQYNINISDHINIKNELETREEGDICTGQNYIIKENITTLPPINHKKFSCIANYSSDSRCYRGACQSCIDYDSSDGLSGNYTDKGITWNQSYSFNPLEGKEDICINSTHLAEYSCNPNDPSDSYITGEVVNCKTEFKVPYSCRDGECYCNSILDYKKRSCTSDEVATLWDANCRVLDRKQVSCDYNNTGVVGDAIPFDSVKIDGEEYDNTTNYTDTGVRGVEIRDNGDIIRFDWDTKDQGDDPAELGDELNLEAIDFSSSRQGHKRGFIFVNNLSRSKTVVFDKFTGSNEVCVKDSEGVDSLNDFSNDCTGSDEVKLNCPGSSGNYNCEITKGGSHYKVWPLKHSGVVELTDSGINTNSICTRSDLNCNPSDWSNVTCDNGTKSRNCNIKQGVTCSGGVSNYETTTCSNDSDVNDGSGGLSGSGSGDVDATSDNLSNNTCTRNDWRCTSWGDCSEGTKKRVCSKKFDSSCSGGVNPKTTSSEGCDSGESDEVKETTQSSEGLPSWALASIIGGAALIVAIIVFFIVSKNKR